MEGFAKCRRNCGERGAVVGSPPLAQTGPRAELLRTFASHLLAKKTEMM